MSILITGASGQLGQELSHLLTGKNIPFTGMDSDQLDITNSQAVQSYFDTESPSFVFHCAAYTAVDAAEEEGKDLNWQVNVEGTRTIAEASERVGATLVYISTDYVFDGTSLEEYPVDAPVNPQNEYGRAKLAGEQIVQELCSSYYIVRTSWVFGEYGKNFVYTMLKLAETRDQLTVVGDQFGRPTWTKTLADFLLHLMQTKPAYGIYHLSNEGSCSWYEFASAILSDKSVEVQSIPSEEYPQKAYRPRHSVMNLSKAKATQFNIPTWEEALQIFLKSI
ncbi:dTDP-4-dehydrorhamnose reductase [Jeotgalibaca sp. MA1X17-3]|uniref:dTDP-4-dehydrorhamnose reductase n=1 Tax=Jeotgalibaca sp. MA1X17-3 TaxID=2908211 RepID=UPI001F46DACA|nr:dTDP-4-dehydrorhamnose reductase [Jeotgalibaca sp. MA1X17-3]UJF15239.1 dTDP-4-dehydrorhamnose reductase [Jeotgalibaca sp. MA1X17-3]